MIFDVKSHSDQISIPAEPSYFEGSIVRKQNFDVSNPLHPKFNVYDIREPCSSPPLCYDFSQSDTLLNDAQTQKTLGIAGRKWVECEKLVHTALLGDWMTNLMP